MFKKILIANRGEISCRIAKTAAFLGIETVAVYSAADKDSRHVQLCDEAIYIGPAAPNQSYLCAEKIIQAAKATGAQAIHPGYGFLAENAQFAEDCASNNIVFIGPSAESIRSMGSKNTARKLMLASKVPVLPGYDDENQDEQLLVKKAKLLGYPLLIKAVAGGGGKGMRTVYKASEFIDALQAVKRESTTAFADDGVLLERYLPVARHVEVQIFADTHGNVVHLFDRDCSMQRRHQKVIEEAPAPDIDNKVRQAMADAAVKCAQAINYVGAGTVEFLLAPDEQFYFMEMNTRLQVEHPVTEMVTGLDLVAWQLIVAYKEVLPLQQNEIKLHGHAFESRLYAENTEQGFLPSIGNLAYLRLPDESASLRIEIGVREGDDISSNYDPMIAKLVTWGDNREQALATMRRGLNQFIVAGLNTNVSFLLALYKQASFQASATNTTFIESNFAKLVPTHIDLDYRFIITAAIARRDKEVASIKKSASHHIEPNSPWDASDSWRNGARPKQVFQLAYQNQKFSVSSSAEDPFKSGCAVQFQNKTYRVSANKTDATKMALAIDVAIDVAIDAAIGVAIDTVKFAAVVVAHNAEQLTILIDHRQLTLNWIDLSIPQLDRKTAKARLNAPMPGSVIACHVAPGNSVIEGQPLITLEAMKMEHTINAPRAGRIKAVYPNVGDLVKEGELLLAFVADEDAE